MGRKSDLTVWRNRESYLEQHSRWRRQILWTQPLFVFFSSLQRFSRDDAIVEAEEKDAIAKNHEQCVHYIPQRPERDWRVFSHPTLTWPMRLLPVTHSKVGLWRHTDCCLTCIPFCDSVKSKTKSTDYVCNTLACEQSGWLRTVLQTSCGQCSVWRRHIYVFVTLYCIFYRICTFACCFREWSCWLIRPESIHIA